MIAQYAPLSYPHGPINSANWFQAPLIGGTNSIPFMPMWGIVASLGANVNIYSAVNMVAAPASTLKCVLRSIANATSGVARVNLGWVAAAVGANFDTVTFVNEGVQSITWASGNDFDVIETKITMNATTLPTAGQDLFLRFGFETASWTLAQKSHWSFYLLDE